MRLLDRIIPLLSRVPKIVEDVEKTHHGKSGAEKHAAAMDMIKEGLGAADEATPEHAAQINAVAQQISGLIPSIVGVLNVAGLFKKKGKPAVA